MSVIALGANLPGRFASPAEAVEAAIRALQTTEITLISRSRLYRSAAWPDPSDPEFVNAVITVMTDLNASELLERLHTLEAEFGRERRKPNAPRPLDLDIVDHAGRVSAPGDTPILPHPRMADRAFVLLPLAEIVPDWRHPVTGAAIADLVRALPDPHAAVPL
ncbi:MAG TPA: 2-amino-4-hydroxy-6-hydroxymethyldihydropteridine diphosphokinase [Alphaproteobacteria bacterium]|nr:2-amino-4-hydroxy-6-hydroxymethyldihydropteridine diphosphokinase [Alphaproteobacteria bacterium]